MSELIVVPMISLIGNTPLGSSFGSDIIQMCLQASLVVKFVLLILVLFSVISWTIVFAKWRFFRKAERETAYFLDLFWENTEFALIYKECDELLFSPVAQIFRSGYSEFMRMKKIQNLTATKHGEATMNNVSEYVERSLKKTSRNQANRMENALSFLATTGNTAPFIGLFGTVWGIMESFRGIGLKGSASLAVVAPGISEALIATAAGLAAAIPAVVAFNYFNNKVSELNAEMETFAADFLGMVERQAIKRSLTKKKVKA